MRAFVAVRQYVFSSNVQSKEIADLRQRIRELEIQGENTLKVIANIGEDTLESINNLSEDIRNEIDGIYLALTELSDKKSMEKKRNPIGFLIHDKQNQE